MPPFQGTGIDLVMMGLLLVVAEAFTGVIGGVDVSKAAIFFF